ncbi:MAG: hypothetical protein QM734_10435 [Cyclobacteriaceae bacterium]
MKSFSLISIFLALLSLQLYGQSRPNVVGAKSTRITSDWTLLSDKDNLVFHSRTENCNGQNLVLLKVQNNTGKETHVFVSLAVQDGRHAPKQVLILKAGETVETACAPSKVPFMPVHLRQGQEPIVSLEYSINKQL